MMIKSRALGAVASLLLVHLLFGHACAGFVRVAVSQAAEIIPTHGDSHPKILLKYDIPQEVIGSQVDYAEMEMPVYIGQMSTHLAGIKAWALSADWNAETVSWAFPWSRAGGDLRGESSPVSILRAGDTRNGTATIRIDVTDIVQFWADSPVSNNGLVVTSTDLGFTTSAWEIAGSNNDVVLRVYFTNR